MLHDLAANTGMIYLWNAKLTKLRNDAMKHDHGGSAFKDDDTSDALDDILEAVVDVNSEDADKYFTNSRNYIVGTSMQDQEAPLRQNQVSRPYSTFDGSPPKSKQYHTGCSHLV
jgi:hypothetical protein